jgi:hypothetical protein
MDQAPAASASEAFPTLGLGVHVVVSSEDHGVGDDSQNTDDHDQRGRGLNDLPCHGDQREHGQELLLRIMP